MDRQDIYSQDALIPRVTAESLARQGGRSTAQLDTWRKTAQAHEQAAIGQRTYRSTKETKKNLKELERRIGGQQTRRPMG